jgi:hypothetical protein
LSNVVETEANRDSLNTIERVSFLGLSSRCSASEYFPAFAALIKKKKNFLKYKEIQKGAVAKSYMTNGLSYMTKYLRISSNIR